MNTVAPVVTTQKEKWRLIQDNGKAFLEGKVIPPKLCEVFNDMQNEHDEITFILPCVDLRIGVLLIDMYDELGGHEPSTLSHQQLSTLVGKRYREMMANKKVLNALKRIRIRLGVVGEQRRVAQELVLSVLRPYKINQLRGEADRW